MSEPVNDPRVSLLAFTRDFVDRLNALETSVRRIESFVLNEVLPRPETLRGPHKVRLPSRNSVIFVPTVYPVGSGGLVFEITDVKATSTATEARRLTGNTIEVRIGKGAPLPAKLTFKVRCSLERNRNAFVETETEFLVEV